jgi:CheY-like chemotaxis protein
VPDGLQQGCGTILLVEGDELVRGMVRDTLVQAGYTVIEAWNGIEAARICKDRAVVLDLLLTDIVMPRLSGHELAAQVRRGRPTLRVLFSYSKVYHSVLQAPRPRTFLNNAMEAHLMKNTNRRLLMFTLSFLIVSAEIGIQVN